MLQRFPINKVPVSKWRQCQIPWFAVLVMFMFVFLFFSEPAQAEQIQVLLFSTSPVTRVEATGHGLVLGDDRVLVRGERFIVRPSPAGVRVAGGAVRGSLWVESPGVIELSAPGLKPRRIRGRVTFHNGGGKLRVIARVDLEDYVAGCVAGEMPAASREALRAQAVVVRSFALENRGRHGNFDFCDSTHCQHFIGCPGAGSPYSDAAMSTRGIVVYRNGRPAKVFYHSTCGGHTSSAGEVFGGEGNFFSGVSDLDPQGKAYCCNSPHFRWKASVSKDQLGLVFPRLIPGIDQVKVTRRSPGGRALQVVLHGGDKNYGISGYLFWQEIGNALGWGVVESAWFQVSRAGDRFDFFGRGLGHGVGMCQYGAMELARRGAGFERILMHYFPGCQLRPRGDLTQPHRPR